MRISDWSSDVCSSELEDADALILGTEGLGGLADLQWRERLLQRGGKLPHRNIVARHDLRAQRLRDLVGGAAARDRARRRGEFARQFGRLRRGGAGREVE